MDFRGRVESFEEADRRYAELSRKRDAGEMSAEDFESEARQLMVREPNGRWWAKLGESGAWHYRDGGDWVRGTPPNHENTPPSSLGRETSPLPGGASPEPKKRGRFPIWIPIVAILGILIIAGVIAFALLAPLFQSTDTAGSEGMGVGQSEQQSGGQPDNAEGEGSGGEDSGNGNSGNSGVGFEEVFVHRATGDTISNNSTFIDNPATNGNPDAILIVTQNWNPGGEGSTYNDHEIGVWYESGREQWAIFNQDREPMTQDAAFNVAVR